MNVCRLVGHRWRYHGLPEDRRVCATCRYREWLTSGEWAGETLHRLTVLAGDAVERIDRMERDHGDQLAKILDAVHFQPDRTEKGTVPPSPGVRPVPAATPWCPGDAV